jgi:hypothetical protein
MKWEGFNRLVLLRERLHQIDMEDFDGVSERDHPLDRSEGERGGGEAWRKDKEGWTEREGRT